MRLLIVIGIAVIAVLQYRFWFGDSGYFAAETLVQKIDKQTRLNDRLEQRNRVLAAEVDALKNGLDAVEARARSDLGMVARGETFYLVVDPKPEDTPEH